MQIGLIGRGRMGQTLAAVAREKGYIIQTHIGRLTPDSWKKLEEAEIIIDFSHAEQVPFLVKGCTERGLPLITGTTGWQAHLSELIAFAERFPSPRWLWGANFSRGIALLKAALSTWVPFWSHFSDWEAILLEIHHRHKKDAPSGTAKELAQAFPFVKEVHSLRVGEVIGEHRLILSASGEEVELLHRAFDRRIFAEGALWAAVWLLRQKKFVGSFETALSLR
ncbi:MAG: dihydrodipicolinate reductase C-terminal domain-containing protein [Bacteroidia bacterium]|nr:hypothetical protein [Bacteroidia bacterium]MDW8014953.1 dihydrodipicolinate reductase C-terminal domain-containing protein [Bacteroidia bacterium]